MTILFGTVDHSQEETLVSDIVPFLQIVYATKLSFCLWFIIVDIVVSATATLLVFRAQSRVWVNALPELLWYAVLLHNADKRGYRDSKNYQASVVKTMTLEFNNI